MSRTAALCPYHAAENQTFLLHRRFAVNGILPETLPLLPDRRGNHVTKLKVIESLRQMAPEAGDKLTGHTLRVTGARLLAPRGVDLELIMLMARW
eukprot:4120353-Amphidinium_carterae.1